MVWNVFNLLQWCLNRLIPTQSPQSEVFVNPRLPTLTRGSSRLKFSFAVKAMCPDETTQHGWLPKAVSGKGWKAFVDHKWSKIGQGASVAKASRLRPVGSAPFPSKTTTRHSDCCSGELAQTRSCSGRLWREVVHLTLTRYTSPSDRPPCPRPKVRLRVWNSPRSCLLGAEFLAHMFLGLLGRWMEKSSALIIWQLQKQLQCPMPHMSLFRDVPRCSVRVLYQLV